MPSFFSLSCLEHFGYNQCMPKRAKNWKGRQILLIGLEFEDPHLVALLASRWQYMIADS